MVEDVAECGTVFEDGAECGNRATVNIIVNCALGTTIYHKNGL